MPPSPTETRTTTVPWALFGLDGRIGRQVYWLAFLLTMLVMSVAITPYRHGLPTEPDLYFLALFGLAVWSQVALVVKRLHDRGLSGFFALLMFVPLVNFGVLLMVGLIPGETGPNRFGPASDSRGRIG